MCHVEVWLRRVLSSCLKGAAARHVAAHATAAPPLPLPFPPCRLLLLSHVAAVAAAVAMLAPAAAVVAVHRSFPLRHRLTC